MQPFSSVETRLCLFIVCISYCISLAQRVTQVGVCTDDCDSVKDLGVALNFSTTIFWHKETTNTTFLYGKNNKSHQWSCSLIFVFILFHTEIIPVTHMKLFSVCKPFFQIGSFYLLKELDH